RKYIEEEIDADRHNPCNKSTKEAAADDRHKHLAADRHKDFLYAGIAVLQSVVGPNKDTAVSDDSQGSSGIETSCRRYDYRLGPRENVSPVENNNRVISRFCPE